MCSKNLLHSYLSRALSIKLEDCDIDRKGSGDQQSNQVIRLIGESQYVLTLDYTIKMLNIHERYKCGMPVIIEGETGVGKTALVEMLSKLWNQSVLMEWKRLLGGMLDFFQRELSNTPSESEADVNTVMQCREDMACTAAPFNISLCADGG